VVSFGQTVNGNLRSPFLLAVAAVISLPCGSATLAQRNPAPGGFALSAPIFPQEEVRKNPAAPCVEPPPVVSLEDYQGPLAKAVGVFARHLELKSVHNPHYKPGAVLCTLKPKDKFLIFVQDTVDPVTFLTAGFNAGLDQAQDNDPSYGQGAAGYGKRFAANIAGQATSEFFKDFAYPTLFSTDPRYYRLAHGPAGKRFLHALGHAFVAHREDGTHTFNTPEWLGTTTAVLLSNTYHPDNERGFVPTVRRVGLSVAQDMGFDVLREFWPEVAHKLKLPFRDQNEPTQTLAPAKK